MSVVRTCIAATIATVAVLATAEDASAERIARPTPYTVRGVGSNGYDFSVEKWGKNFGAGFQAYGRATATNYQSVCDSYDPARYCATITGVNGAICKMIAVQGQKQYCGLAGNKIVAEAMARSDVAVFGKSFDLFDVGSSGASDSGATTAEWGVYVLGKKIAGRADKSRVSGTSPSASRTFLKTSATFSVGPIPVTVGADAVGSLGVDFEMAATANSVAGSAAPYAAVNLVLSAGVGTRGASAGVYGDLLLVKVSTPASASITIPSGGLAFPIAASLDIAIDTLDGEIGLYAELGNRRWEQELFSWSGYHWQHNIGKANGYISL